MNSFEDNELMDHDPLHKEAERWNKIKKLFRVMSLNIDGNHTWSFSGYGYLVGGSLEEAVDNLK